jgi:hypothetical protein
MQDRGEARAMTDQMLGLVERLAAGEAAKRTMVLGTREFADKASEVEGLARLAFRWSQLQLQVAERAQRGGVAPDAVPLDEVEPRPLDIVLSNWREAQLRLEIAHPGSDEARAAANDVERLREEYQATFEVKQR